MKQRYTITAIAKNKPGVLYRIADLLLRRKINIESLTVSEIEHKGMSRFTIVIDAERDLVEKVGKQLYRIIEMTKVIESTDDELVAREVALIKVTAKTKEAREEVEQLVRLSTGRIIHVDKSYLVVEITGNESEIDKMSELLQLFGIKEIVRSGRIAVFK